MDQIETLQLKLAHFEGPLDLLLYLTKKMEVDLADIPIAEITNQYMEYIHSWQNSNLVIAGEYLVMASTLMAIKSQMLLPQEKSALDDEDFIDEEFDPRLELAQQLAEYQTFKEIAEVLSEKEAKRSFYFTKPSSDLSNYRNNRELPLNKYTTIDLFVAISQIIKKKRDHQPLQTHVTSDSIKISDCMVMIEEHLFQQPKINFANLFSENKSVEMIVTTFLALLELLKMGKVSVQQTNFATDILIFKSEATCASTRNFS